MTTDPIPRHAHAISAHRTNQNLPKPSPKLKREKREKREKHTSAEQEGGPGGWSGRRFRSAPARRGSGAGRCCPVCECIFGVLGIFKGGGTTNNITGGGVWREGENTWGLEEPTTANDTHPHTHIYVYVYIFNAHRRRRRGHRLPDRRRPLLGEGPATVRLGVQDGAGGAARGGLHRDVPADDRACCVGGCVLCLGDGGGGILVWVVLEGGGGRVSVQILQPTTDVHTCIFLKKK